MITYELYTGNFVALPVYKLLLTVADKLICGGAVSSHYEASTSTKALWGIILSEHTLHIL